MALPEGKPPAIQDFNALQQNIMINAFFIASPLEMQGQDAYLWSTLKTSICLQSSFLFDIKDGLFYCFVS